MHTQLYNSYKEFMKSVRNSVPGI